MNDQISIDDEDVYWIVIVGGEEIHREDSKELAKEWAEENGIESYEVASVAPWPYGVLH